MEHSIRIASAQPNWARGEITLSGDGNTVTASLMLDRRDGDYLIVESPASSAQINGLILKRALWSSLGEGEYWAMPGHYHQIAAHVAAGMLNEARAAGLLEQLRVEVVGAIERGVAV